VSLYEYHHHHHAESGQRRLMGKRIVLLGVVAVAADVLSGVDYDCLALLPLDQGALRAPDRFQHGGRAFSFDGRCILDLGRRDVRM